MVCPIRAPLRKAVQVKQRFDGNRYCRREAKVEPLIGSYADDFTLQFLRELNRRSGHPFWSARRKVWSTVSARLPIATPVLTVSGIKVP